MKKIYSITKLSSLALLLGLSWSGNAQDLIHYWNFNTNSSIESLLNPSVKLIESPSILHLEGGSSLIDFAGGTGQNFNLENLNARNGDEALTHLRFNNPIGGELQFHLPTTGYDNIMVKFVTRRSGSGAGLQKWYYTTNGTDYTFLNSIVITEVPTLQTLDFSFVNGVKNNPNFKLKVAFEQGDAGTVGNNRFDNFTVDGTTISDVDTSAPIAVFNPINNAKDVKVNANLTVTFNEVVRLTNNNAITNENVKNIINLKLNNASGIVIDYDAIVTDKLISITPKSNLNYNQVYYLELIRNAVEDLNDNQITETLSSTFTTEGFPSKVGFSKNFVTVKEEAGKLNFTLKITAPVTGSVDLVVKESPFSTADANDFTLKTQTLNFTAATPAEYSISIPIVNDNLEEQHAEYFVLSLENPVNFTIDGTELATIYIIDNDRLAPVSSKEIELNYVTSFDPSGENTSTCEVVAYDKDSKKLFATSAVAGMLDIIDFSNPTALKTLKSIDINSYGGITSVAVKNGIVAVASPNANEQLNGSVVFFNTNGDYINQVTVGALPDMITFTPDGKKVLTANEGQPSVNYSVDPEGSVSIIDISGGLESLTQNMVKTLLFTAFNENEVALIKSGIRKTNAGSTLSQDLEPEFITIAANSKKAWVTLQENNAIAEINLENNSINGLWAMGTKDMSKPGNGFDVSDNNGEILIANWPVNAYYIPDAVANYQVNGINYLVTANEGDEKEYETLNERTTIGANNYGLDSEVFPQAKMLKQSHNAGRLRVTNLNGNTDEDADYEKIHCLGSRSFSIFNADSKSIVFDSGDDFEMITAADEQFSSLFNSDHEENKAKGRSRSKGPEPEGVIVAEIQNKTFVFIALERIGGIMVYEVTNPENPVFVDYKNTRSTSAYGGDLGAETLTYISEENSPNGKPYIVLANEISGTLTIFEIDTKTLSVASFENQTQPFSVFPNPTNQQVVYFNRMASVEIFDLTGKKVLTENNALSINISGLTKGMYIVKTNDGATQKLVIK